MIKKAFLFFVFIFAFSSLTFAHGTAFFEYAPRVSSRLVISSVATPSQIFRPQNDFLSGFDFWVDNEGDSGAVLFELFDSDDTLLRSRSVTVPTTPKLPGGQRFHVDFLSQMPISNLEDYHIKVTTSMPDFSIYHANRLLLLQHTNETVSQYDFGAVQLGEVLQDYTFKSALYETQEDAPPVISNLLATVLSFDSVQVDFNANEAVDFKVDYGPQSQGYVSSTSFSETYEVCGEGIAFCSANLAVFPDTAYAYRVIARDAWGNESEATGTFQSATTPPPESSPPPEESGELLPEEDVVAPTISNARVVSVTDSSVRVAWTTDEVADAYLSITLDGGTVVSVSEPIFELEHVLQTAAVLQSITEYRATLSSRDLSGNVGSTTLIFTTDDTSVSEPPPQEEPQTQPPSEPAGPEPNVPLPPDQPTPESPVLVIVESGSDDEDEPENIVTVRWITPQDGLPTDGYRVDLFDANFKLQSQSTVEADLNELQFTDLAPGDYYVVVYANDGGVFERIGKVIKFTVKRANRSIFYSVWFYVFIIGFVSVSIVFLKIDERRREREWRI